MIYRHPDNSFRRYPPRVEDEILTPINGRPGWFHSNRSPMPVYREPPKPLPDVLISP